MSLQTLVNVVPDDRWDAFLASTPGGSYKQTGSWARVKALQGWRARRIVVHDETGERVLGGAQILVRPLPVAGFAGRIGYVVKGPLVMEHDPVLQARLLHEIDQLCRVERISVIIVQPPEDAPPFDSLLLDHGYIPSPLSLAPTSTVVVDLDADIDVLRQRLGKQLRRNIRRAEAAGVVVRHGARADLDDFYRLLSLASQRLRYPIFPRAYYERIWDEFSPKGGAQLFVAELDGQVVSIQLCVTFRRTMFSKALAWSGQHRGVSVNDALDWYAIAWARAHGIEYYDLESISDDLARRLLDGGEPTASEMRGSDAYKLKWSRRVVMFPPPYLRVTNPVLRGVVRRAPERLMTSALRELRARFRPLAG
jgi:lipid II:glycine glycyltransferase (peptidoglycan interpeptide bridge formation enzyme)